LLADPTLVAGHYWYEDEAQGLGYSVSKSDRVTGTHWVVPRTTIGDFAVQLALQQGLWSPHVDSAIRPSLDAPHGAC
jgi:hypothetical protein